MKNSLEFAVEDYFIQLFASDARLVGKPVKHFDEDEKALTDCIVIEATQGEEQLEGPRGNAVDVTCTFRSSGGKIASDVIIDGMRERITSATSGLTEAEELFANPGILQIYPERITGDRSLGKTLRKRSITIPVVAKLK